MKIKLSDIYPTDLPQCQENCPFLVALQEPQKGKPELAFPAVLPRTVLCIKLDSVLTKRDGAVIAQGARVLPAKVWFKTGHESCKLQERCQ